jgi:hypothetical protein
MGIKRTKKALLVAAVEQLTKLYRTDAKRTLLLVYRGGSTLYLLLGR